MKAVPFVLLPSALWLAACGPGQPTALDEAVEGANAAAVEQTVQAEALNVMEPLEPPAPGMPGGLPVDPEPISEGAIDPSSPQGAAQVVQLYYGLLEQQRFAQAQNLWSDQSDQAGEPADSFARRFAGFSEIHANVGAPSASEGAAGSAFVTVPVQLYARVKSDAKPYYALRTVTLRRVNDVPGASAGERRWHIERIGPYPPKD